jgi:hypothetical protein
MSLPFAGLLRSRGARLSLRIVSLYAAVYLGLSFCGSYQDNISSLAKLGLVIRGMPDQLEWQPALLIVTRFPGPGSALRANAAGYVFLPVVLLDQHLIHKNQPVEWYESAVFECTRANDCVAVIVFLSAGLWWLLFPAQAIRFYCWLHAGKLKTPTPLAVRLAGLLWFVLVSGVLRELLLSR